MVVVRDRPFLEWILLLLAQNGLRRIVLATGHRADQIEEYFARNSLGLDIVFSREPAPLGTGGALRLAANRTRDAEMLVMNGDTFCRFDLELLFRKHSAARARATLWLAPPLESDRFGSVELDPEGRILAFREKEPGRPALANAGVYLVGRSLVNDIPEGQNLSIERDLFPAAVGHGLFGVAGESPFVDIGTPESLAAAEQLLGPDLERLGAG